MPLDSIGKALFVIGGLLAFAYAAGAIIGVAAGAVEEASDAFFWLLFLLGGAILLALGLWLFRRGASPWGAAAVASIGAIAGAFAVFWSIAGPLGAIAVVVLSVLYARRLTAAGTTRPAPPIS